MQDVLNPSQILELANESATKLCRCKATAEQVAADVAGRLWDNPNATSGYVVISVKNAVRDAHRQNKRRRTHAIGEGFDIAETPVVESSTTRTLDAIASRLTGSQLAVFELKRQGLSSAEIADELQMTVSNVDVTFSRLKTKLAA